MSRYNRASNDYSYGGDDYLGGGRWDRDRFERVRATSRGPRVSESVRYEEEDRYGRGGDRRDIRVEIDDDRRGGGYQSRDRYYEDDRYSAPRRPRPEYLDDDRGGPRGYELAPYQPRYDYRDYPPARPNIIRRQSSLDTFDRRTSKYNQERDVTVNLNVRSPPPPPRREEYVYDDGGYRNSRYDNYIEEDYGDVRIRRERERSTYRYERDQGYDDSSPTGIHRRRGKTRMPKRLVHRSALVQLGYAFEEEEYFYIVRIALGKDEIDEVIRVSETYWESSNSSSYKYNESKTTETSTSQSSHGHGYDHGHDHGHEQPAEEVTETVTTKVIENPTEEDYEKYRNVDDNHYSEHYSHHESHHSDDHDKGSTTTLKSPSTHRGHRSRSRAHSSHARDTEVFEEHDTTEEVYTSTGNNPITTLVLPERRKSFRQRDIKAEIKALEAEKRALKAEREAQEKREKLEREIQRKYEEAERIRDNEVEFVERRDKDVVRVEKDRREDSGRFVKSRSRSRSRDRDRATRPRKSMVEAALYTLT